MKKSYYYRKYIVPLIFVFLFSKVKAELNNSAFSYLEQEDISMEEKKYKLAKKLYDSEEYSKALKYALELVDNKDVELNIKTNMLVGNILRMNYNNSTALNRFKKVLLLVKQNTLEEVEIDKEKNELYKAEALLRMSSIYLSGGEVDSSKMCLKKLINISSLNNEVKKIKGDAYSNMGAISIVEKDFKSAEKFTNKAIETHESLIDKDPLSISIDYNNLGNIYMMQSEFDKAKENYIKGLSCLQNENSIKALENKDLLNDNLAWVLYNLRDYKAYNYLYKSNEYKEELKKKWFNTELKKIELKHNIDLIKKEEENKRVRLERNNWLIGITGVSVSLLLLYLTNVYKLRQHNLKLKLSTKELEQQRSLDKLKSESQVKIINAALDGKESERKQIAETLHDNVSALLSSANMHLQASQKQFKGELPLELQKTQDIILEASQKIRDLSHNLVSSILLKFGLEYAIKDIAQKYSNSSIKIHTAISNVNRYSQDFEIKVFNIVQELLNNILKHSKAKTAYITMEEDTSVLSIIIKDDGVGFDVKEKAENGIGLNQIKARIHVMQGHLKISSSPKNGTKIAMDIPVVERGEFNFS